MVLTFIVMNDVWKYSKKEKTWSITGGNGILPYAQQYATMWAFDLFIWVFSGQVDSGGIISSIFEYTSILLCSFVYGVYYRPFF